MKITVAVVTRDRPSQLRRCLKSLERQSILPSEILIIDTPYKNSSYPIFEAFSKKLPIRYILKKARGIAKARNIAIQEAGYPILAFLDDDCEAEKNWVKHIIHVHSERDENAIQGWSKNIPLNKPQSIISQFNLEYGLGYKGRSRDISHVSNYIEIVDTRNISFKVRKLRHKGIKFNEKLQGFDEIDIAKQLLSKNEKILFCPKIKVKHWERAKIITYLKKRFKMAFWKTRVYTRWEKYFTKNDLFWYPKRVLYFLKFCLENKYILSWYVLFPLFIIENVVYFLGILYGRVTPKKVVIHQ